MKKIRLNQLWFSLENAEKKAIEFIEENEIEKIFLVLNGVTLKVNLKECFSKISSIESDEIKGYSFLQFVKEGKIKINGKDIEIYFTNNTENFYLRKTSIPFIQMNDKNVIEEEISKTLASEPLIKSVKKKETKPVKDSKEEEEEEEREEEEQEKEEKKPEKENVQEWDGYKKYNNYINKEKEAGRIEKVEDLEGNRKKITNSIGLETLVSIGKDDFFIEKV